MRDVKLPSRLLVLLIKSRTALWLFLAVLLFISMSFPSSVYADDDPVFSDEQCFAVADEPGKLDTLIEVDLLAGTPTTIGRIEGASRIEALAVVPDPINVGQATIYAANAHLFGKLDIRGYGTDEQHVIWLPIGEFGRADGSDDGVTLSDVDGLTYDIVHNIMYGVHRRIHQESDLLFVLDLTTGRVIRNYFQTEAGPADYVEVDVINGLHDVDDIAIHPETREMFGIINDNGRSGILVELDPASGRITQNYTIIDVSGQIVDDLEGLAFTSNYQLYGSTGEHGPDVGDKNQLFQIDLDTRNEVAGTVQAANRAFFDKGADDVEGLGCLTTPPGTPAITVEKSTNKMDADEPGSGPQVLMNCPVTWDYTVTNSGELDLTNVQLDDDKLGPISCPSSELLSGESMICSVSDVAEVADYANLATVTALSSRGEVSDTDPSHYTGVPASIVIEKATNGQDADQAPGPYIPVGEPVTWSYVVTNTSGVQLLDVTVSDDKLDASAISCPTSSLAPGESMSCTATGVAQADQYANVGTVTALPENGCVPVTDSDPSHYFGTVPGIALEKFTNGIDADLPADGPTLAVGCDVRWSYEITNTGNVLLEELTLVDDQIGPISCTADSLAVGDAMTCSSTGTAIEGAYANIGTVTAFPKGSKDPLTATDPSHYHGLTGAIDIEKSTAVNGAEPVDADEAPGPFIQSGATVTWLYSVVNTGALPLINVVVVDDQVDDVSCPQTELAVGESMVCTASGTAISGQYANIATVYAKTTLRDAADACSPVTDSDPSHYFGILPDLDIAQTVVVGWSYNVTNTGEIPLENVAIDGGADVDVSCPTTTLDMGQAMTCTATGPQARFENDATVRANPVDLDFELIQRVAATPITSLLLDVLVNGEESDEPASHGNSSKVGVSDSSGAAVGDSRLLVNREASWQYTVSNESTYTVERISGSAIAMVSGEIQPMTCPQSQLAPTESMVCTVTKTTNSGRNGELGTIIGYPAGMHEPVSADVVSFYQGVVPATVGGRLFVDKLNSVGKADGRQDIDEEALHAPNVELDLLRFDGTLIATSSVDKTGQYEFSGLFPDDYYIVVRRPVMGADNVQGYVWSPANQTNDRLDSDANPSWDNDADRARTEYFRLSSGEIESTWDFGFQQRVFSGSVFVDANGNGKQDDGEQGLKGVTISLFDTSLSGSDVIELTTDDTGSYAFEPVDPGTYSLQIVPPAKYDATRVTGVGDGNSGSDGNIEISFALSPNFGSTIYLPLLTGSDKQSYAGDLNATLSGLNSAGGK